MRSLLLALPLLLAAAPPAVPQQPLTLARVFASPSLSGPSPRAAKLSPDGRYATLLKPRPDDAERYDLWAIDTTTGAERMLVDSTRFGGGAISEAEKMRRERARVGGTKGIVDYDWAPDGKSVLVPVDGDLYLATLDGAVRRLTDTPESELDAKVSDGGRYVSFVAGQNLHAIDLASGADRALTTDGKGSVTCGTAEFVAQEELDRRTGHWWAPDDGRVAVECYDEAPMKEITRASIGATGTTTYTQRYPLAGTPNVLVSLWVVAPEGGRRVKVDLGPDPDIYLARVDWAQDGRTLYVQRLSRDQKRLDMLRVDPATGASSVLFSETSPTWVDLSESFRALKDGSLIWVSQRDGYRHLYRWKAGAWTQLTRGPWMVGNVIGVDEKAHRLTFTANKATPVENHVYAVDYARPAEPRQLTEGGYWNEAAADKDGRRLLVQRSSPDQPPQVYFADADGKRLGWIERNALDASHPYAPYLAGQLPTAFGTLKATDGSTLHYRVTRPATPGPHPAFVEVYGGPAGQTVRRAWAGRGGLFEQYLARKGWVVFSLDGRGTPHRGTAFESQIYEKNGTVEVEDQLTGLAWLKAQPDVDPKKVALFGWSNGGYMTLRMLEKAPGAYAAGVAVAPVTRWELYDTAYTERYMGDPRRVPDAYKASDLIDEAGAVRDPLLVMHGMADDNVFFDNTVELVSAMQDKGVPFEMMVYPGKTHSISGSATQTHLYGTMERFLDDKLGLGGQAAPAR
ncbi:DPP IV N-terminal domain-containing protein [Sphingomonas sp.]|uniref:S9 family peptidase n=1 Tax=Sphingomonas sp. TaxID=28214 RepID=UPI003AFF8966